jgi:D-glycero-D-manno-heptose 1,7-bisphosphate phosphatase
VTERARPQAALLDRDGTIIADRHYLNDPDEVKLLPGAAAAIRRLSAAGVPSIVCTNQSGIARGAISLAQYDAVRRRVQEVLAMEGAQLLDTLSCPHHPDVTGPCDCRKPALGLYTRAARLHGLDLSRCLFVGDRMRDVTPARAFGGDAALVESTITSDEERTAARAAGIPLVDSLAAAVEAALGTTK